MIQLKYSNDFKNIIEDIPFWQSTKDIPLKIKNYIEKISNQRVIYKKNTKKFYCNICMAELDENNYCKYCNINYPYYSSIDIENKNINIQMASNDDYSHDYREYFVFDIINNDVYLYIIGESISYNTPLLSMPHKVGNLIIKNAFFIMKDKLIDFNNNKIYYHDLDNYQMLYNKNDIPFLESQEFDMYVDYFLIYHQAYLYLDNIDKLKNTIYKYSKMELLKDYWKKQDYFNIASLTLFPLYYPQFEYLVNYKLYNLAINNADFFKPGKNFKEIFGIEKSYLPFMQKYNITLDEYMILKLNPITDISTIRYFTNYFEIYYSELQDIVLNYNIKLTKLKDYLTHNNYYLSDYLDYISMLKELQIDAKDKDTLYPQNLRDAHDKLFDQIKINDNPTLDFEIKKIADMVKINKYEDDNYVIYPVSSTKDLINESKEQRNCVRMYVNKIINNECQIYFMRKKDNIQKSFVTIEVRGKKIVQAKIKYNKEPDDDIKNIINKWESSLIDVTFER